MPASTLLLDTQLLLLLVAGSASQAYIRRHKRLQAYTEDDYRFLVTCINCFSGIAVTPNTLTETSNLLRQGIQDPALSEMVETLALLIGCTQETYVPSKSASEAGLFLSLGLTDSVLLDTESKEATLLTADLQLYLAAIEAGRDAINFSHLRDE